MKTFTKFLEEATEIVNGAAEIIENRNEEARVERVLAEAYTDLSHEEHDVLSSHFKAMAQHHWHAGKSAAHKGEREAAREHYMASYGYNRKD